MDSRNEEVRKELERDRWKKPKKNWGFWLMLITFIVFLITWWIIRPLLMGG